MTSPNSRTPQETDIHWEHDPRGFSTEDFLRLSEDDTPRSRAAITALRSAACNFASQTTGFNRIVVDDQFVTLVPREAIEELVQTAADAQTSVNIGERRLIMLRFLLDHSSPASLSEPRS